MFQLLFFGALYCSFLQAADQALVPFKNPTFNLDTKKEYTAGLVFGSLAISGGLYAGAQLHLVAIPIVYVAGIMAGGLCGHSLQDRVGRFQFDYKSVGEGIAQQYAGIQSVSADTKAFSAAYERLRIKLEKNSIVDREELECDNMLKKIVSKRFRSDLHQDPKIRDEHNRLCDDWQKQYKLLRFMDGFMAGALLEPVGLFFLAKMGILASAATS